MDETIPEPQAVNEKKLVVIRIKRRLLKHIWLVRIGLLVLFLSAIYLCVLSLGVLVKKTRVDYYWGLAKNFIFTPQGNIKSFAGQTNILILGKAGAGHDSPDLTDTIIFASVSQVKPSIALISLPRDIWIPSIRAKLNSAYFWGNQKEESGGLVLAKSLVEEVVGQPVHYALIIDFSGFKKIIDILGGVEVDIERDFTDEKYPIPGRENDECGGDPELRCRYETLHFVQGKQLMDGETVLKFVRSRNADGEEGTDLAREARQQKVIAAIKQRLLSRQILFSPQKIFTLLTTVKEFSETDIDSDAAAILTRQALSAKNSISSHVLSEDFLTNPPKSPKYDNLYVFIPKNGNWDEVHKWVKCLLEDNCR